MSGDAGARVRVRDCESVTVGRTPATAQQRRARARGTVRSEAAGERQFSTELTQDQLPIAARGREGGRERENLWRGVDSREGTDTDGWTMNEKSRAVHDLAKIKYRSYSVSFFPSDLIKSY